MITTTSSIGTFLLRSRLLLLLKYRSEFLKDSAVIISTDKILTERSSKTPKIKYSKIKGQNTYYISCYFPKISNRNFVRAIEWSKNSEKKILSHLVSPLVILQKILFKYSWCRWLRIKRSIEPCDFAKNESFQFFKCTSSNK